MHPQERGTSSKVNVYDEILLLDDPEYKFLEPVLKKLEIRCEALPLLNLRYLDWTTVFATAACNLRFDRFGSLVLCQLRYASASHKVFTSFRDVTEVQKRARWGSFSGPR